MSSESHWAGKRPIPFVNTSGETIPAFAVMAVRGVAYENGIAFLQCDKPSAAFVRQYAVNNIYSVPPGLRGTCFRGGEVRALYDVGSPAAGEGWGPKPGQWSLSKGYPAAAGAVGIVDAAAKVLLGSLREIDRMLVKTTAAVGTNVTTVTYTIYGGTLGAEVPLGFTSVPPARNRGRPIASGEWALLVWVNNGWELREVEAGVDRVWYALAVDTIAPGATGTVLLADLTTREATNWSLDVTISAGERIFVWLDSIDNIYLCIKGGGGEETSRRFKATLGGTLENGTASVSVTTTAAFDGGSHPGNVTAQNPEGLAADNGSLVFIEEDWSEDPLEYVIYQVHHVEKTALEDVRYDKPELIQRPRTIVTMQGNDDVEDDTILTTQDQQVTTFVFVAGLNIWQYVADVTVIAPVSAIVPVLVAPGTLCTPPAAPQIDPLISSPAVYPDSNAAAFYAEPASLMSPAFF
jgi:hypothetical protein